MICPALPCCAVDRICTVEATALFLSHIGGADSAACAQLVECVRINNSALRPTAAAAAALSVTPGSSSSSSVIDIIARKQNNHDDDDDDDGGCTKKDNTAVSNKHKNVFLYGKEAAATHPCWYYGHDFYHDRGPVKMKQTKAPKHKRRYL
jgi:hypothetical protein